VEIMAFDAPARAMKAELLDAETELQLAYAWRDHRDEEALHRLITPICGWRSRWPPSSSATARR
jgi:hypothetical protein